MRQWFQPVGRCAVALALWTLAGCHPAQAGADCSAPPPWQSPGAKPGRPDAELAACLKEKAYDARGVKVPLESKVGGVIAQCEVEVDRFEGDMVLDGAMLSDERRAAVEREAQQEATAAVLAYQPCAER